MSNSFIKDKVGSKAISEARKQQKQLTYFTQGQIQDELSSTYIEAWAERNYSTNDEFLNWVKMIFRTDNFLTFFKYFRNPVASARLVNDRIKPQLKRVFFSEDAFFKYTLDGQEIATPDELDVKEFNDWMFNALLFRHNDILVTDLRGVNEPFRQLVSINNVVAIDSSRSVIHRLAYTATVGIVRENGDIEEVTGYLYMDKFNYIFYDKELTTALLTVPHDLGECPADFISDEPFSDEDAVRKSIFSHQREDFESYVFLKTLLKMSEVNGALPIVTKLKTKEKPKSGQDIKGSNGKEPMTSNSIGGQHAELGKEVTGSISIMQTGTIVDVPVNKKVDGSIDMDMVKNFLNFFYIPTESLKYIRESIQLIESGIISTALGDSKDQNESAKNELQISMGFVSKEDVLRGVSTQLTRIRERSDHKFLGLQFGVDRITNEAFYGSDFFLESENDLYNLFDKSPNTIERKNILIKLTKNRNRFNKDKSAREVILYHLLPYVSDADFLAAREDFQVDDITFQYQTRFNYWVGLFEATYGDILLFWEGMGDVSDHQKLSLINNLIIELIKPTIVSKPVPEEGAET